MRSPDGNAFPLHSLDVTGKGILSANLYRVMLNSHVKIDNLQNFHEYQNVSTSFDATNGKILVTFRSQTRKSLHAIFNFDEFSNDSVIECQYSSTKMSRSVIYTSTFGYSLVVSADGPTGNVTLF